MLCFRGSAMPLEFIFFLSPRKPNPQAERRLKTTTKNIYSILQKGAVIASWRCTALASPSAPVAATDGRISPRLLTTARMATRLKTGMSSRFSITQHTRIIYFKWQWIFFFALLSSKYLSVFSSVYGFLCNFWSSAFQNYFSAPNIPQS